MFFNITGVLPRLSNLDGLLSHLVQLRKEIPTIGSAKKDITSIVCQSFIYRSSFLSLSY